MKKLFLLLLLVAPAFGQTFSGTAGSDLFVPSPFRFCMGVDNHGDNCAIQSNNQEMQWTGSVDFKWAFRTVGTLPASSILTKGRTYEITDGQSTTDCSTGGGSAIAICTSDGTTWNAIGSSGGGSGSGGVPSTLTNCTAAGTTLNEGVELSSQVVSSVTQLCGTTAAASSQKVVGICTSGCGSSGAATIAYSGYANGIFDGQTIQGDYAVPSSNGGQFTDIGGAKPSGTTEVVGIVASTNTGGGTLSNILIQPLSLYTPGGTNNSGNINNAPQFQIPYYSVNPAGNVLSGAAGTTDGSQNSTFHSLATNGAGTGTWTTANGTAPLAPSSGNSSIYTDSNGGHLHCVNSSGTDCAGTSVDVRVGYGGSGGVDCTGGTDSTAILQNMINNAPDFTKFVFPANCHVLVSTSVGSPTAITINQRSGLEFWMEGHNANSCDGGQGTNGGTGAKIFDSSAYASGARIFYINQSQRVQFHNMVIWTGGAVDSAIVIDQTSSPPITTANTFTGTCIYNNASANASFVGISISPTSLSNVESQNFYDTSVTCANVSPVSASSNGIGILYGGGNANQKTEQIDTFGTHNCSIAVNPAYGSTYSVRNLLDSSSWINVQTGVFNGWMTGNRFENSHNPVSITNSIGPFMIDHSDFAVNTNQQAINCNITGPPGSGGCGTLGVLFDESDNENDWFNVAQGNSYEGNASSLWAVGNRNLALSSTWEFQNGTYMLPAIAGGFTGAPSGQPLNSTLNSTFYPQTILSSFGQYLSPALESTSSSNYGSAPLIFEDLSGAAPQHDAMEQQLVPNGVSGASSAATMTFGALEPSNGVTHWLAFSGLQSGLALSSMPSNAVALQNFRVIGSAGSSNYCYQVVAHGNVGTVLGNSTPACIGTGPSALTGANYIVFNFTSVQGATSYDVYRTTCGGGSSPCGTGGATGLIQAGVPATCALTNFNCAGNALFIFDQGAAGNGAATPSTNTTGVMSGAVLDAPPAYTIYPATDSSCTVYSVSGTQYCAVSNTTGTILTNTDAAALINSVLSNLSTVGGTLHFRNGVYNLNSATQESNSGCTYFYSIGIPTGGQYHFRFIGESGTTWVGEGNAAIQTNGVLFNVTSTAVTAAGSNFLAAIWQRPSGGSGCSGFNFNNYDSFENIAVRFPTNQRGNEGGFVMWAAGGVEYHNVLADFNIQYSSIASGSAPVVGTAGSFGLTGTYNSSGNVNYFYNANVTGFDICYDLGEHTMLDESQAIYCNHAAEIGRSGTANLFHGVTMRHFVDQENLGGILIGPTVQKGTVIDILNYDVEIGAANWYSSRTTANLSESNPGNAEGIVTYITVTQGNSTMPYPLFASGQGQSTNLTVVPPVAPQRPYNLALTDNFTRANAPTLGSNWMIGNQAGNTIIPIVSNKAQLTSNVGWESAFGTYSNNQFATITIGTVTSNANSKEGAIVRNSNTVQTFYRLMCAGTGSTTSLTLDKTVAASTTSLQTSATVCGTGDTLELDVIGTQLFAYYTPNGGTQPTVVLTATDSAITSGNPGLLINGSGATTSVSGFTAGSLPGIRTNANATISTPTNCAAVGSAASPSVAACASSVAGSFSCATNASTGTCTVNTVAVTANSEIFVHQRTDTTTGTRLGVTCNTTKDSNSTAPQITAVTAGTSFSIQLGTVTTNPECFSYQIIN